MRSSERVLMVFILLGLGACASQCPLQKRTHKDARATCPAMTERDLSEFAKASRASH